MARVFTADELGLTELRRHDVGFLSAVCFGLPKMVAAAALD